MVQTERDGLSHQHTLRFPLCVGLCFAAYWSRKVGSWKAGIPVEPGLALCCGNVRPGFPGAGQRLGQPQGPGPWSGTLWTLGPLTVSMVAGFPGWSGPGGGAPFCSYSTWICPRWNRTLSSKPRLWEEVTVGLLSFMSPASPGARIVPSTNLIFQTPLHSRT